MNALLQYINKILSGNKKEEENYDSKMLIATKNIQNAYSPCTDVR